MKTTNAILGIGLSLIFCLFIGFAIGAPVIGLGLFAIDILRVIFRIGGPQYSLYEAACGLATASILKNCEQKLTGGTGRILYITNRDDIESIVQDDDNPLLVSSIVMKAAKKFFKVEGSIGSNGSSVGALYKMVKLAFGRAYDHQIDFLAFDVSPDTKQELSNWADGDLVAIVENKYRGEDGNAAFEMYGYDGGLQFEEFERNPNDKDTLGAFKIQLKTQENSREGNIPYSVWDYDYTTTKAMIESLL